MELDRLDISWQDSFLVRKYRLKLKKLKSFGKIWMQLEMFQFTFKAFQFETVISNFAWIFPTTIVRTTHMLCEENKLYLQLTAAEFVNLHELVVLAKIRRRTVAFTTSSNEFIHPPKIVNIASDSSQSSFSILKYYLKSILKLILFKLSRITDAWYTSVNSRKTSSESGDWVHQPFTKYRLKESYANLLTCHI